jgi:HAD superfamily hydrolase (TIGR01490 family)
MTEPARIAFYDLDGTLVSSNIVTRYAFFVRHLPSSIQSFWKTAKLVASVPGYLALDHFSRRRFNEVFFREYQGMMRKWLLELSNDLYEQVVRPSIYPGARALLEQDRAQGFRLALVTGELDFVAGPLVADMGFDVLICNRLVFENGFATGEVVRPLIAERAKVHAMTKLCDDLNTLIARCKGYSDSFSDAPMLEAVGDPAAVNPDQRLKKVAAERGWRILDLRRNGSLAASLGRGNHVRIP